ncbi:DUF421 domain-containing protein [Paucisalibacillus sp. EB02]|uniref:DUF421 domain-containing protein n=1 Tax=Paucisalibacillus sp. EB02 TaxID=1347087 RepID=UPI0004ACA861|nr:YetF domain-containing protein [Paucisalibacillus sp. EB02]
MDFFSSQETLTWVQWTLRALVGFTFFVVVVKVMGQRTISQVGLLDFVIVLLIGNIIAHPLSDEGLGLEGSMITMVVILVMYLIGIGLSLHVPGIRKLFIPSPIPLIENGSIIYKNLKKVRISIDILMSELRKNNTEDIQKVALALWEPGGTVSIFLRAEHQTLTPSTIGKTVKPFKLPKTVIKEKKIDYKVLEQLGKDDAWLLHKISSTYQLADLNNILLATVDDSGKINVLFY